MSLKEYFLDEDNDDYDEEDFLDISGKRPEKGEQYLDDHHSPMTAKRYLKLRVEPMIQFYQKRMPRYYGRRIWSESLLIAGAVATTLMAAFRLQNWTAIVATFMGLVTAWSSFVSADKKLTRYTNTVEKISVYVLWWRQLSEVEKLMVERIKTLVEGCEDCFEREYDTWCSTSITRLQVDLVSKPSETDERKDERAADKAKANEKEKKQKPKAEKGCDAPADRS